MTAIAIGLTLVSAGALRPQTRETKTTTKTKKAPLPYTPRMRATPIVMRDEDVNVLHRSMSRRYSGAAEE